MQTGKPKDSQRRKAGTIPKVSRVRRCPGCQYYAPSGKCLNTTLRSGRCGDWVWYMRNGKRFRRLWSKPRDSRTPLQLYWRERLGAASKRYSQGLTDGQRDACIAAGARLQSRPRLFQSGPLTGQQYEVRQQCSTRAAVGARSAGTVAKPLQTQGISASTWEHYRSATVALPWQCPGRTAHPGRIITIGPVRQGPRALNLTRHMLEFPFPGRSSKYAPADALARWRKQPFLQTNRGTSAKDRRITTPGAPLRWPAA